ncbi:LacI family DNA-binding transcriptional regulator [Clostridium sp. Marseille-P2415]|uniref:LacI family DNA-binding transcriptional regulator n=1 Tax=Clostridium sp. Marseille-P2415 TaxID=1805471 RepID=UPI000988510A|nr:LacI family DNA-binding transcriptional regulator [Clostridium sp. Marseille-P2415]
MESINIKDIARICGVGVSTVSRAINNHPDINQETKNRIMQVIKENNYIPNNSARNLKRTDSRAIVVLIKGIGNPFFGKMIRIFEEEIQKKKYSFIMQRVDEKEDEVDVALELIKEKKPRGIVFLGGYFSHSKEELAQLTVPYVLSTVGMTEYLGESPAFSCVSVDDFAESYKMVDYLCKLGHKRILILAADPDDESIGRLRLEGYKKALTDNGISPDPSLIRFSDECEECYSMANGHRMMTRVLKEDLEFTAVYAISDSIAIGACKAVFENGKRIPEDYSIAGFDGLDIAHFYNPAITTIRQPVEEMAEATIGILFDVIKNQAEHQKKVFKAELVEGQSTRSL